MGVEKRITATEANRMFSEIVRRVKSGDRYVVTSHGKPVLEIKRWDADRKKRDQAFKKLMARLRRQKPHVIEPWTREELYER